MQINLNPNQSHFSLICHCFVRYWFQSKFLQTFYYIYFQLSVLCLTSLYYQLNDVMMMTQGRGGIPIPYPFIYHFFRKGTPFVYLLLEKGTPFIYLLRRLKNKLLKQEVFLSFCSRSA